MKLKTKCRNCKEEFNLKRSFVTRPDLISELGEYFHLQCSNCLSSNEYHANDITAFSPVGNKLIGTVAGAAIILVVTLFFWGKGYVTNIGLIIGSAVIGATNYSSFTSNTKAFNSYKIKRNIKN